jgi:hypothetical protein
MYTDGVYTGMRAKMCVNVWICLSMMAHGSRSLNVHTCSHVVMPAGVKSLICSYVHAHSDIASLKSWIQAHKESNTQATRLLKTQHILSLFLTHSLTHAQEYTLLHACMGTQNKIHGESSTITDVRTSTRMAPSFSSRLSLKSSAPFPHSACMRGALALLRTLRFSMRLPMSGWSICDISLASWYCVWAYVCVCFGVC